MVGRKTSDRPWQAYQQPDVSLSVIKQFGPASKSYKAGPKVSSPLGAVSDVLSYPPGRPILQVQKQLPPADGLHGRET